MFKGKNNFSNKQKEQIIQMYKDGMYQKDIAKHFNTSKSSIARIVQKSNIPCKHPLLTEDRKKKMCEMYISGYSAKKIGEILKSNTSTVTSVIREEGIKQRTASEAIRKYSIDENYFEEINSPNKAYFLGLLAADGTVGNNTNVVAIQLQETDKHILETFKKELNSNHPLSFINYSEKIGPNRKNQWCFRVVNKKIHDDLIDKGIVPRKSYCLKYPTCIPEELHRYFILGYMDGDGNLAKGRRRITFTSTKWFCLGLQKILYEQLGIESVIRRTHNCTEITCDLCIYKTMDARKLAQWMYKDAPYYLFRKYDIYQQYYLDKIVI